MKSIKLVLILCLVVNIVFAQNLVEGEKLMSNGLQNAFSIEIMSSDLKGVEKSWASYIKKYKGKTKKNKKSGEYLTDNASIPTMSSNTVDIYSKLSDYNGNIMLTVWFDLGGAYLATATHPEKVNKAEAVLLEFSSTYEAKVDLAALKVEQDALKDFQNDQKKLVKDHASYDAEIEKMKQRIVELEQKKIDNLKAQDEKAKAIKAQEAKVQKANEKLSN